MEIIRHGRNLAHSHAIFRKIVMDHELMQRQKGDEGAHSLRMLRRLVTNSIVLDLVAFWETDERSPSQSLSLPGALYRLEQELSERPDLFTFPLPGGDRGFSIATRHLRKIIASAKSSPRYNRLKNHRDKYIAHKLTKTRREATAELPLPIYEDVDRLALYSLVALRELSRSIYPMGSSPGEVYEKATRSVTAMIRAWNPRLGKRVLPPT
ncbi:hypothetical protein [Defluviimonas sp. WL0050]|uniref:AbiU2 domain-containing protein n=1 Tax=Albidovulum litorale TaxID=2984134 RepID=UPI0021E6F7CA|nr:hypothetical protein [Defluviimonas sp. WL0050]